MEIVDWKPPKGSRTRRPAQEIIPRQTADLPFRRIFDDAFELATEHIRSGGFQVASERDLQALLFHHALLLCKQRGLPCEVHAEPTRLAAKKPDLVFGENEVFVELKLATINTPETEVATHWGKDVEKLAAYRLAYPSAHCVFIAIDRIGRISGHHSVNYFDPAAAGLTGAWRDFPPEKRLLLAELP